MSQTLDPLTWAVVLIIPVPTLALEGATTQQNISFSLLLKLNSFSAIVLAHRNTITHGYLN